jgi:hypothetical protein
MFRTIVLFLSLVLCSTAAEKAARSCRILFLNAPDDAPEKLHLFDGTASREVELTRMGFSPVYQVNAAATALALLPSPPAAPKSGTAPTLPDGAPKAALAESITDFYLIVTSDPVNKVAPVKMQVIDAGAATFKRGQMLWFNLTDSKVGGQVGSRKLLLAENSRLVLDAPANGMEDYHVSLYYQPPGKTEAEPLCETNWSHDPRSRGVFFVLKPANNLIPRILGFPDFREKPE